MVAVSSAKLSERESSSPVAPPKCCPVAVSLCEEPCSCAQLVLPASRRSRDPAFVLLRSFEANGELQVAQGVAVAPGLPVGERGAAGNPPTLTSAYGSH